MHTDMQVTCMCTAPRKCCRSWGYTVLRGSGGGLGGHGGQERSQGSEVQDLRDIEITMIMMAGAKHRVWAVVDGKVGDLVMKGFTVDEAMHVILST
jgi:hypothetical protein